MNQKNTKQTLIGLLDTHLASVINALVGDGVLGEEDFKSVTDASNRFMEGVQPELLEVELSSLLNLIRPDRYNKAIEKRRSAKAGRNGKRKRRNRGNGDTADATPRVFTPPPPMPAEDLFAEYDF
tara:strand:+ start:2467 stop:2841 length:375 start_codon:yes stop_codon:yes gene_type:complete